jgi:hypothetical protein
MDKIDPHEAATRRTEQLLRTLGYAVSRLSESASHKTADLYANARHEHVLIEVKTKAPKELRLNWAVPYERTYSITTKPTRNYQGKMTDSQAQLAATAAAVDSTESVQGVWLETVADFGHMVERQQVLKEFFGVGYFAVDNRVRPYLYASRGLFETHPEIDFEIYGCLGSYSLWTNPFGRGQVRYTRAYAHFSALFALFDPAIQLHKLLEWHY